MLRSGDTVADEFTCLKLFNHGLDRGSGSPGCRWGSDVATRDSVRALLPSAQRARVRRPGHVALACMDASPGCPQSTLRFPQGISRLAPFRLRQHPLDTVRARDSQYLLLPPTTGRRHPSSWAKWRVHRCASAIRFAGSASSNAWYINACARSRSASPKPTCALICF